MKLLHNNRCSKSREALAWLQTQNTNIEIVDYQAQPLNETQLRHLCQQLGLNSPREMIRSKETLYRELNLAQANDNALFVALATHPKLLERPILIIGEHAVIGRPLEKIQTLYAQHG